MSSPASFVLKKASTLQQQVGEYYVPSKHKGLSSFARHAAEAIGLETVSTGGGSQSEESGGLAGTGTGRDDLLATHAVDESMRFPPSYFLPNAIDVICAGSLRNNLPLIRAELLVNHRVRDRIALAKSLPIGGTGAELGVFTGLFSTVLLSIARPRKAYFVDPWWKLHGEHYGDWGTYTDFGRLSTAAAHQIAVDRINHHSRGAKTEIVVDYSTQFLASLPDEQLNWVYLDTTHSYEGTRAEFAILRRKIARGGILAGDDWHEDQNHRHAGVARAIKEAVATGQCELIGTFPSYQWAVRLP